MISFLLFFWTVACFHKSRFGFIGLVGTVAHWSYSARQLAECRAQTGRVPRSDWPSASVRRHCRLKVCDLTVQPRPTPELLMFRDSCMISQRVRKCVTVPKQIKKPNQNLRKRVTVPQKNKKQSSEVSSPPPSPPKPPELIFF